MTTIEGSCHCGAVRWSVTPPVKTVVKCHCGNCRKLQGSDYSTWVVVPADRFAVTGGKASLTTYTTGRSSKHFCSRCGAAAFLINGKHFPDDIVLALGNLDSYAEALAPQAQVYTPNKASWVTLHDDEPIVS